MVYPLRRIIPDPHLEGIRLDEDRDRRDGLRLAGLRLEGGDRDLRLAGNFRLGGVGIFDVITLISGIIRR